MTTRVEGSIGRSSPDPSGSGSMSGSESLRSRSTSAATDSNSLAAIDPDDPQKPSEAAFANARASRPEVCGSYAPERPYPIYLRGLVERGFGRGGKDLGCPTGVCRPLSYRSASLLRSYRLLTMTHFLLHNLSKSAQQSSTNAESSPANRGLLRVRTHLAARS